MASPVASTQVVYPDPSAVCSLGLRPYLMTGFLRQFLAQHFAAADQIMDPDLRTNLWRPDETTGIVIESATHWTPKLVEGRPGIIVKRHSWQIERLGINNQMVGQHAQDGYTRYSLLTHGSHTLFCIDASAPAAEKLAIEVFIELLSYGALIREWLELHRFVPVQIDEVMQLEESSQHYAVPVTFAYAAEESWTIRPHSPPLKTIGLTLDTQFFQP